MFRGRAGRGAAVGVAGLACTIALHASGCGDNGAGPETPVDAGADQGLDANVASDAAMDAPADTPSVIDVAAHDGVAADTAAQDARSDAGEGGEGGGATDAGRGGDAADAAAICTTTIGELAGVGLDEGGLPGLDGEGTPEGDDGPGDGAAAPDVAAAADGAGIADGGGSADGSVGGNDAAAAGGGSDAAGGGSADGGVEGETDSPDAGAFGPTLLFGFDDGANGWSGSAVDRGTILVGATYAEGHACPGALELATTFTAFGPTPTATYGYRSTADWTGHSRLHFWIKVTSADFSTLAAIQPFVDSNNYASGYYLYDFIDVGRTLSDGGTFSDGGWHEVILDLTAGFAHGNFDPAIVNDLGVQLDTQPAATIGGPSVPSPTTVLVDDIWLE